MDKDVVRVGAGTAVLVDMDIGNIVVRTGRAGEVRYELERWLRDGNDRDLREAIARHDFKVEQRGSDLYVTSRYDRNERRFRWGSQRSMRIDLVITVPESSDVDFKTGAGNVEVYQVAGRIEGSSGAGNISIERVKGQVDVSTGAGNIDVRGGSGQVDVQTGAGNVSLVGVMGSVYARSGAGNIHAEITRQPDRDCRLESGAGNVTVELDDDIAMSVDAHASMGSASTDFALATEGRWMSKSFSGNINGGGPELYLRSGVGSVELKRR